jgi:microcystin-dependent protein
MTTPATNPVRLDGNGRATIYADGNYKFRILDADGMEVPSSPFDNCFYGVSVPDYQAVTLVSADYTALDTDDLIFVSTISGNVIITLPAAGTVGGKEYTVVKTSADANTVTVDAFTALDRPYDALVVASDGTNWRVKSRLIYDITAFARTLLDDADAATARTTLGVYSQAEVDARTPAGHLLLWDTETPPAGFLECDGSAISRTTYATLYAVIGNRHGPGDGSTTFNLPDYRGYFLRSWAHGQTTDPDRATRTDSGDGTVGDHVGTKQADQYKAHTHTVGYKADNTVGGGDAHVSSTPTASYNSGSSGGNETRPLNINVMVCIKY